mmetsp:Transcript_9816/g.24791  ORF Transcript_9816/g.24791 Transcript_9816/m.24791 type:complete len:401 (+) Transcript_9816:438-1640(+)
MHCASGALLPRRGGWHWFSLPTAIIHLLLVRVRATEEELAIELVLHKLLLVYLAAVELHPLDIRVLKDLGLRSFFAPEAPALDDIWLEDRRLVSWPDWALVVCEVKLGSAALLKVAVEEEPQSILVSPKADALVALAASDLEVLKVISPSGGPVRAAPPKGKRRLDTEQHRVWLAVKHATLAPGLGDQRSEDVPICVLHHHHGGALVADQALGHGVKAHAVFVGREQTVPAALAARVAAAQSEDRPRSEHFTLGELLLAGRADTACERSSSGRGVEQLVRHKVEDRFVERWDVRGAPAAEHLDVERRLAAVGFCVALCKLLKALDKGPSVEIGLGVAIGREKRQLKGSRDAALEELAAHVGRRAADEERHGIEEGALVQRAVRRSAQSGEGRCGRALGQA